MVTFTLTDTTTITGVTTYAKTSDGQSYSVFSTQGHRRVPVRQVASIDAEPSTATRHDPRGVASTSGSAQQPGLAWYDLPMAAGMWAADARDMEA